MDHKKPNKAKQDRVKTKEDRTGTHKTEEDRRGPNEPSKTKHSRVDQQNRVKTKDHQMD